MNVPKCIHSTFLLQARQVRVCYLFADCASSLASGCRSRHAIRIYTDSQWTKKKKMRRQTCPSNQSFPSSHNQVLITVAEQNENTRPNDEHTNRCCSTGPGSVPSAHADPSRNSPVSVLSSWPARRPAGWAAARPHLRQASADTTRGCRHSSGQGCFTQIFQKKTISV